MKYQYLTTESYNFLWLLVLNIIIMGRLSLLWDTTFPLIKAISYHEVFNDILAKLVSLNWDLVLMTKK